MKKAICTPRDIGKIAIVKKGTRVRMLEYDLPKSPCFLRVPFTGWRVPFTGHGNQWQYLLQGWIDKGAKVELFVQALSNEAVDVLDNLKNRNGGNLKLYRIGDVPDEVLVTKREDLVEKHFIVFENPRQLWEEDLHLAGKKGEKMYGCKYHQDNGIEPSSVNSREQWEINYNKYTNMLNRIVNRRKSPVKISVRHRT